MKLESMTTGYTLEQSSGVVGVLPRCLDRV